MSTWFLGVSGAAERFDSIIPHLDWAGASMFKLPPLGSRLRENLGIALSLQWGLHPLYRI